MQQIVDKESVEPFKSDVVYGLNAYIYIIPKAKNPLECDPGSLAITET